MNPFSFSTPQPWGELPAGVTEGTWITGESCTDIPGPRTGAFSKVFPADSRVVALVDERDGSLSFVSAGSVKTVSRD